MTKPQALKYLHQAERNGFAPLHHGAVLNEPESTDNGDSPLLKRGIRNEQPGIEGQLLGHSVMIRDTDQGK